MNFKILEPIHDDPVVAEKIEQIIRELLMDEIYRPLVKELYDNGDDGKRILNRAESKDPLVKAIEGAKISFYRGMFRGRLSAPVSKRLKELGAMWDRREKAFKMPAAKLPARVKSAIKSSQNAFNRKADRIEQILAQILPEAIAKKLSLARIFDAAFFKVDKGILGSLTVEAVLTDERRLRLSKEYEKNYQIAIKGFTQKEITKLRQQISDSALSGNRYETMIQRIRHSHGVSLQRAKTIAREETRLMLTTYKEIRYQEAGVAEYMWKCAAGSPSHPVRPLHKKLEGTIFRWDTPPIVNERGDRKSPGKDFGCRCYARPIVRFNK